MGISIPVKRRCILAGFICLLLISDVDCSDPDLEVKGNLNSVSTTVDGANNSARLNRGSHAGALKKDKQQLEQPGDVIQNGSERSNSSRVFESKEGLDGGGRNEEQKSKGDNGKEVSGEGLVLKSGSKEEGDGDSNASLLPFEKGKLRVEECDHSNMCTDDKNNLVACLQVPGDESPNLLLLIRNKGRQTLSVGIIAAELVQLEKTHVQLEPKEDKKVKVSIEGDGVDSLIYLIADQGQCTLDFRDLISRVPRRETQYIYKLYYLNSLSQTRFYLLVLFVILVLASAGICMGFGRKYFLRKVAYQPVETELPISDRSKKSGSRTDTDLGGDVWDDEWDSGWGEDDADVEAPVTPTLPLTPSLSSSRGLATRRPSKEGWMD